jgi:hypothetical protein
VLAANANTSASSAAAGGTGSSYAVTVALPDQQAPAIPVYNAFEFSYRSDYGKIILREQNIETGQEVTQVPSEYHLQQYAAAQRAQRVQQQAKLYHLENAGTQQRQGAGAKTVAAATAATGKAAVTTAKAGEGASAPAAAPAPAPQAAVAVAAAAAHVDIKV